MVRSKGTRPPRRTMTIGERQDIAGMKAEAVATLKHATEHQVGGQGEMLDKGRIQQEINRYDTILKDGAPKQVRGTNKDNLIAEARGLEEKMQKNMPTLDEMNHPEKNPGAVQKHIKWGERNKENVSRFKEIMRTVEPDDPTATNIDKLRREK